MHALHEQKEQRLGEHASVVNQKAGAGRKRLSTLVHVHGDTTNVSVRGGERERAHLWGCRAATLNARSEAFFNRFTVKRDSWIASTGFWG